MADSFAESCNLTCSDCGENGNEVATADCAYETAIQQTQKGQWLTYPFLLLCATVGNLLMIFVFTREEHMRSTNWYMICNAAASFIFMWFEFSDVIWNLSSAFRLPYRTRANYAQLMRFKMVQAWVIDIATGFSDWITVMFSLERLLVIANPFKFAWLQEVTVARTASLIVLAVFAMTSLYEIPRFYYGDSSMHDNTPNETHGAYPDWLVRWGSVWEVTQILEDFGAFFALLVINAMVIFAIRRHNRSAAGRQRSAQQKQSAEAVRSQRNSNILLMACVGLYFITQTPLVVLQIVDLADPDEVHIDRIARLHFETVALVLLRLQYSLGFFVYMSFSRHYRAHLFQSCFLRSRREKKYAASTIQPGSSQYITAASTSATAVTVC